MPASSISQDSFKTKALLLHHGRSSFDLTVHDVIKTVSCDEAFYQMGAGRVLGIEEKNEIAATLTETAGASLTLFDEHILAATAYAIAWWIPAAKRTINFKVRKEVTTLTFDFPSQVAVFSRGTLYFASVMAKKSRPKATTKLFNSPLPNLYSGGRYCTGNTGRKIPKQARVDNIPQWERFLFDTTNTHFGSAFPLEGVSDTQELIDVIAAEQGGFPSGRLVPMGVTLTEWINAIDKNNTRGF